MRVVLGAVAPIVALATVGRAGPVDAEAMALLRRSCGGCHDATTAAGGFSIESIESIAALETLDGPLDGMARERLARMHDRVRSGEMPPPPEVLPDDDRRALLGSLAGIVTAADLAAIRSDGRVPLRRLNRQEFEQALRTILELPDLDVADGSPPS